MYSFNHETHGYWIPGSFVLHIQLWQCHRAEHGYHTTKYACDMLCEEVELEYLIRDFFIEGQLASDKKPS